MNPPRSNAVPPPPGAPRVLVADDEPIIGETLCVILREGGFDPKCVNGGREAIEQAQQWNPDIFLCDVLMPEVDGIEAAIAVTQAVPACRILLFSGQTTVHDLLHNARLQGYDFELLAKPIHPTELLAHLRRKK